MIDLPHAIGILAQSRDLSGQEMEEVMGIVMEGKATPAQIGAFVIALRIKGEAVEELAAAARVVRKFASEVVVSSENVVDIVGTGGDGARLFNVSTA